MDIGIDDDPTFNVDYSQSQSESEELIVDYSGSDSESDESIIGFQGPSEHGDSDMEESVHTKSEDSADSESEGSNDSESEEPVASKSCPSWLDVAVDSLDVVPPSVAQLRQELQGDYKPPAESGEQPLKARVLEDFERAS